MLWCLHGFLGRGADWDPLRQAWPATLPALHTPDLFAAPPADPSLPAFGERFANVVTAGDRAPLLLGYSLGGRLALHALLATPGRWHGAVIVSAHLGLDQAEERAARRAGDEHWAARFRDESWDTLLAAWNAQDVFGGRAAPLDRPADAFDRSALAHALTAWSLGTQTPLTPALATLRLPILWIAGADDPRYVAQGEAAARACPNVTLRIAPAAGHRVPWEQPDWFRDEVVGFVRGIGG